MDLYTEWRELCYNYTDDKEYIDLVWLQIKESYSQAHRYYHNLEHIQNLLLMAQQHQSEIGNYDLLLFSIWFHDIVYNPENDSNEEESAEVAKTSLSLIISPDALKVIQTFILSTNNHIVINPNNCDNGYFLDFDLAILGSQWPKYLEYLKKIRMEYERFADQEYIFGRIKFIQSILKKTFIYHTSFYRKKLEKSARTNLKKELDLLTANKPLQTQ